MFRFRPRGGIQLCTKPTVVVGVPRTTLEGWEAGDGNNEESVKASTPDCRTSIGKKEYETIYRRAKGEGGWRIWA